MQKIIELLKKAWKEDSVMVIMLVVLFGMVMLAIFSEPRKDSEQDTKTIIIEETVQTEEPQPVQMTAADVLFDQVNQVGQNLSMLNKQQKWSLEGQRVMFRSLMKLEHTQKQLQYQMDLILKQQKAILSMMRSLKKEVKYLENPAEKHAEAYRINASVKPADIETYREQAQKYDIEALQKKLQQVEQNNAENFNPVIFIQEYFKGLDEKTGMAVYEI